MNLEEAKRRLQSAAYSILEEKRLPNNTGTQLRLNNGAIVNVFDNGTCNVQGQNKEEVEKVLGITPRRHFATPPSGTSTNKVFVAYGHDRPARDQLEAMLRRWLLEPLIIDQLPSEGQTIIEKLENCTVGVNFGVVLATPDDEGHRRGHSEEKKYRTRQNVVLELGMLLALLGRPKVAILLKEQENMEPPSDIDGLIYIPFNEDVSETGPRLAKEMANHGYAIDIKRL